MQQLLQDGKHLFAKYTRGKMANNCDPECCPADELNAVLQLPLQEISAEYLHEYYLLGPDHIGEISDYKYFLPTLADYIANRPTNWDSRFLSTTIVGYLGDWTTEEKSWLNRYLKALAELPAQTNICVQALDFLNTDFNRLVAWRIFSNLYGYSGTTPDSLESMAQALAKLPFSISELAHIAYYEVDPACSNSFLRRLAGHWKSFTDEWLIPKCKLQMQQTPFIPVGNINSMPYFPGQSAAKTYMNNSRKVISRVVEIRETAPRK